MTKEEAIYWKSFILRTIEERLPQIEVSDLEAYEISEFANKYMQTITGQQMLPQGVFREFLRIFAKIPEMQSEIAEAQVHVQEMIEHIDELIDWTPITEEQIAALFPEEQTPNEDEA